MTGKKIGIITADYPPHKLGGGARSAELLTENLKEKGYEVEVLTLNNEAEELPSFVETIQTGSTRVDVNNIKSYRRVKEFAKDKDLIHEYNGELRPLTGLLDTPVVSTLNGYNFLYPHPPQSKYMSPTIKTYRRMFNWICRKMIGRIDKFTALSKPVRKYHSRFYGEDIEIVPNMYDPEFPTETGHDTQENEILYIGRLAKVKGVDQLIEQVNNLPEYNLKIVGDGPEREYLEKLVKEKELEERVSFEGYVPHNELNEYYERAEIFVHPGKWPEPFGRTILEAMQKGTPVIATNRGGPSETLPESHLVDSMEEFPEKIRNLDRSAAIEEQSRRLKNYKPETVTQKYVEIYEQML